MQKITKNAVLAEHAKQPRRKCFFDKSGIQKDKQDNRPPSFSTYIPSARKIFEAQTGLNLEWSSQFHNYWRYVSEEEITQIEEWEKQHGSLIFLRDCLSLSVALDHNLKDNVSGQYTEIGLLENNGKQNSDKEAVRKLAEIVSEKIPRLPCYKDADLICSVPSHQSKIFDLPREVASLVSQRIQKTDVTSGFVVKGQKEPIRGTTIDQKWDVWESAQVSFQDPPALKIRDKKIILIDDKYQSGITIQYIAMKLQEAGAKKIYGLSFVKTLRDTDNT